MRTKNGIRCVHLERKTVRLEVDVSEYGMTEKCQDETFSDTTEQVISDWPILEGAGGMTERTEKIRKKIDQAHDEYGDEYVEKSGEYYSTVTLFARLRGLSIDRSSRAAVWYEASWSWTFASTGAVRGSVSGISRT